MYDAFQRLRNAEKGYSGTLFRISCDTSPGRLVQSDFTGCCITVVAGETGDVQSIV
jgi:hypothetical protein